MIDFAPFSTGFSLLNPYISYGTVTPLDSGTTWTFSVWVEVDNVTRDHAIVSTYRTLSGTGLDGFIMWMDDVNGGVTNSWRITAEVGGNAITAQGSTNSASANTLTHLVATFDTDTLTLYKDGTQIGTGTNASFTGFPSNGHPCLLGNVPNDNKALDGTIGEFAVWDRVLADHEITSLANRISPLEFGPVLYDALASQSSALDEVSASAPTIAAQSGTLTDADPIAIEDLWGVLGELLDPSAVEDTVSADPAPPILPGTYERLKTDVTALLRRDGDTQFDLLFGGWVSLFEAQTRALRLQIMLTTLDVTVSSQDYALPSDCLELRSISLNDQARKPEITYVPPNVFWASRWNQHSDHPRIYTMEGTTVYLAPTPAASPLSLVYFKPLAQLINRDDTNTLISRAYDFYVYGVAELAANYLQEWEMAARFRGQKDRIQTELIIENVRLPS